MNGSPLVGGVFASSKEGRSVEQARLVVAADPHRNIRVFHLAEDRFAESAGLCSPWISAKKRAADAQIKDNTWGRSQVGLENRGGAACVGRKPSLHFFALWHRAQTTGIAKRITHESWMNRRELLQRFPRRGLADRYVRIVGDKRSTMRGIRNANREPHPDERVEKADLGLFERKNIVIAGDNGARRT